jgi:hypothetical protein
MSSTDRQNRLLLAEDWKRVYQSFRNADFQSYDFDNLRRTMISYLRENYPEDFNDYVESSEYLALIDLIAFLGQNIAFRIDLNSRENFLELADRRESVLRLARLLSYNPKRVQCANGLLKISSVRTTEEIRDSNNINLQNQTIVWNDPSNVDWYEQFIKVMNSALPVNGTFGRPVKKANINGVPTEQYRLNSTNTDLPVYAFNKTIDGRATTFELVSTDISNDNIVEEAPFLGNNFALLYRDDGRGPASSNSGFFSHFRQGNLDEGQFNITNPISNQTVSIEAPSINNTDVWLYKLDSFGNERELWTKVDALEGNNVIYNSVSKKIRNIYNVLTRVGDRINLVFSDGTFGDLPRGQFKIYYRTSLPDRLIVSPEDMRAIAITIPYLSKLGKEESITITLELKYTVDNSSPSETNESIKSNAPSTYYTQNRMITGEDYQVAPLGINQEIIKVKAVNRISSGISRYFDLIDATGKYSQTTLFGNDGVVYKEFLNLQKSFNFTTRTDVEGVVENTIVPILNDKKLRNYYHDIFPKVLTSDLGVNWVQETKETNLSTGYFKNRENVKSRLGSFTASILKLVKPGAMVKMVAPGFVAKTSPTAPDLSTNHFMPDGTLKAGIATSLGSSYYNWVKILSVNGPGVDGTEDGFGAVKLNDIIPGPTAGVSPIGAILAEIKPTLPNNLTTEVKAQVIDQIFANRTFGIRFDRDTGEWRVITENNLNVTSEFSTGKTGDATNQRLDSSWLLWFKTDGEKYTITYRAMRFVFESDQEIRFYYDSSDKIYNTKTGKIVKDKITVLSINNRPDETAPATRDYDWEIVEAYRDAEGYVDSKKIEVSFYDDDEDGVVDDVDLFTQIVAPIVNTTQKYVIFKKYLTQDGVEDFNFFPINNQEVIVLSRKADLQPLSAYNDGQIFYYIDLDVFEVWNKERGILELSTDYKARLGRDKMKFRYIHAADSNSRIDPSASNIVDLYLLTKAYDTSFRLWLLEEIASKPLPPSSDQLFINYSSQLNQIKSLSDEIIYHPVKYKILFGKNANDDLKATFKVVKNPDAVLNDNDIKARVIAAMTQFFALENWEFGETFYFSELSSYVMNRMAPDLVTFVIVPFQDSQSFGSLFEIKAEADEIFISGATVDNVEIIDAITASRLKSTGNVVTQASTTNVGIQSTRYTS